MDLSFIQEQLDTFSTFGGAIEDIWGAIRDLFGVTTEVDGEEVRSEGGLESLSSYLEGSSNAEGAEGAENGDGDDAGEGSSLPGSSDDTEDAS